MMGDKTLTETLRDLSFQSFGFVPRPSQEQAATLLEHRVIVEMETGEGKTLAVAMAAVAMAVKGRRVFVATANDYLATRDAQQMTPMFEAIGLSVAAVSSKIARQSRGKIYSCDVVYGTIRELGFDTLSDELASEGRKGSSLAKVPKFHAFIIDEADSVLIDEALTPLVITGHGLEVSTEQESLYRWSAAQAERLRPGIDYRVHSPSDSIALTDSCIATVIHSAMPETMTQFRTADILHSLERAVDIATRYQRDVHYLVNDAQVMLVDENTGRIAQGKKLGGGLHQAIEAKERLPITKAGRTVARMTIQELVNQSTHLCGVTATAFEERRELGHVYGLRVKRLQPDVPSKRQRLSTRVFSSNHEKLLGVISETRQVIDANRAVLIGTRTIEQSEKLAGMLSEQGVSHVVLNAKQSSEEATIVALAGQLRRVTVATNMAGRGTDIKLSQDVREAGGLHVILSAPHLTARIDRQLEGRTGRQGDPGTVRRYLAADETIFAMANETESARESASRFTKATLSWKVKQSQAVIGRAQREQRHRMAIAESHVVEDLQELGLNPHLERLTADEAGY